MLAGHSIERYVGPMIAPEDPESAPSAARRAAAAVPTAEPAADPAPAAQTATEVDVDAAPKARGRDESVEAEAGSGAELTPEAESTVDSVPAEDQRAGGSLAATEAADSQLTNTESEPAESAATSVETDRSTPATTERRAVDEDEDFDDEDFESEPALKPGEVPIEVTVAAGLMGVVVVLQLLVPIQTLLAGVPADRWGVVALTLFQWFGFLAAYLFFGYSAYRGEHWARIVLLVFAVVVVLGFLADSDERVFGMAAIMHTSAVIMLFLPGARRYFRVVRS